MAGTMSSSAGTNVLLVGALNRKGVSLQVGLPNLNMSLARGDR